MSVSEHPTGPTGPVSALPSVAARVVAFVGIFIAAGAGGLIGYAYATIQCSSGSCDLSRGFHLWAGSLIGALGAAAIATVTLRARGEWNAIPDDELADS